MLSPIVSDIEGGRGGDGAPRAPILRDAPPTPNNTERGLRAANCVAFVLAIAANAVGASGKIPGSKSVSDVSSEHRTSLTPAGFTFSIWGVIYTLQALFVLYQAQPSNVRIVRSIGIGYILTCAFNAGWIFTFTRDSTVMINISLGCIFGLVATLSHIYAKTAGCWKSGRSGFAFVCTDIGFSIYTAWVLCASAVGTSITLQVNQVEHIGRLDQDHIQIILLVLAGLAATALSLPRQDFVFPLVLTWASYGIHQNNPPSPFPTATAIVGATMASVSALALASRLSCKPPTRGDRRSRTSANDGYWR